MAPSPADEEGKCLSSGLPGPALIHLWIERESIILEITFKAFHFDTVPVDLPGTVRTD